MIILFNIRKLSMMPAREEDGEQPPGGCIFKYFTTNSHRQYSSWIEWNTRRYDSWIRMRWLMICGPTSLILQSWVIMSACWLLSAGVCREIRRIGGLPIARAARIRANHRWCDKIESFAGLTYRSRRHWAIHYISQTGDIFSISPNIFK